MRTHKLDFTFRSRPGPDGATRYQPIWYDAAGRMCTADEVWLETAAAAELQAARRMVGQHLPMPRLSRADRQRIHDEIEALIAVLDADDAAFEDLEPVDDANTGDDEPEEDANTGDDEPDQWL